ncbi:MULTISPECIES: NAD(P)-binding oxidoreductase [Photorhabdus]|uniref:NAD(P)H-binding protein n=2 Tax=Photorhabdus TaxID=29487 RepID=A0ABX0AXN0_9GAMM|nr:MULTISPECIES: NAD(P)-binding oxidoreductase [Photorhabdus]MCC8374798.1 SDR family oxidoreductase [Photorhabdus bodei]MCC8464837.1 SDR family oxidoreductase [Photorhabdus bodei]MCT8352559.1 SDR family oxidoreductase [Photorhabdus kayaii]MDB6367754.1 SDR family oxidoreductase [Photorhabdus bodei]MDB6372413.1 SDR family oxidoreductase [Photorhabdus bodei]
MKPWLIFGAGSGVGRHLVTVALQQKRPVIALIRNFQQATELSALGVKVIQGDACNAEDVEKTVQHVSSEAIVFSTIGGIDSDLFGNMTIIDAIEKTGITRMLLVTSIGCSEGWKTLSPRAKSLFGQSVRLKSMAESYLQTSSLNYTIIRPGGLTDKPGTGHCQRYQHEIHGAVSRQDVAHQLATMAEEESSYQQIYTLVDPELKPDWAVA